MGENKRIKMCTALSQSVYTCSMNVWIVVLIIMHGVFTAHYFQSRSECLSSTEMFMYLGFHYKQVVILEWYIFLAHVYFGIFTEPCCIQTVKSGLLILMLRIFERWDRYEGKIRLKICSYILATLQHLCSTSELNYCVV